MSLDRVRKEVSDFDLKRIIFIGKRTGDQTILHDLKLI